MSTNIEQCLSCLVEPQNLEAPNYLMKCTKCEYTSCESCMKLWRVKNATCPYCKRNNTFPDVPYIPPVISVPTQPPTPNQIPFVSDYILSNYMYVCLGYEEFKTYVNTVTDSPDGFQSAFQVTKALNKIAATKKLKYKDFIYFPNTKSSKIYWGWQINTEENEKQVDNYYGIKKLSVNKKLMILYTSNKFDKFEELVNNFILANISDPQIPAQVPVNTPQLKETLLECPTDSKKIWNHETKHWVNKTGKIGKKIIEKFKVSG